MMQFYISLAMVGWVCSVIFGMILVFMWMRRPAPSPPYLGERVGDRGEVRVEADER